MVNGRVPTLDGWRAIAVLLVILCHGSTLYYPSSAAFLASRWPSLGIGVDIFFVISGIVITTSLLRDEQRYGAISLGAFYARRAFRILPPVAVLLVVLGAFGLFRTREEIIASCLFFRNFLPSGLSQQTEHLWSLSVEEQFYLCWPLLLILVRKRSVQVLSALIFAVTNFRLISCQNGLIVGRMQQTQYVIDGLMMGCLVALLMWPTPRQFPAWLGYLALASVSWLVYWGKSHVLALTLLPSLISVMLVGTILNPECLLSRLLEWAPLQVIGRASYGIYLWQTLFTSPLPIGGIPTRVVSLTTCVLASYFLVERPMRNLRRSLSAPTVYQPRHEVVATCVTVYKE